MLFVCSKLGFPIFSYGGSERVDVGALSKLVVTAGAMTERLEFFQISMGSEHYTAKPFMVSEHYFYCVCSSDDKYSTLVTHLLGSTIQLVFWEEFSVLLAYLDHKSSTEMNSTTIMDTLGKGSSHIDDILSEVFAEESVRDNFLMFEEHFMRGLDTPQQGSVFDLWFAPLCALRREAFSVNVTGQPLEIGSGGADLFVQELPATHDAPDEPLPRLFAERIVQPISMSTQKLSGNRRPLALSTRCLRIVNEYTSYKTDQSTKVAITPDMVALVASVVSGSVLLVLQFPLAEEHGSSAARSVPGASQGSECLSQELRGAWLNCCENIATALPRPTHAPRDFELTPRTFEKLLKTSG